MKLIKVLEIGKSTIEITMNYNNEVITTDERTFTTKEIERLESLLECLKEDATEREVENEEYEKGRIAGTKLCIKILKDREMDIQK